MTPDGARPDRARPDRARPDLARVGVRGAVARALADLPPGATVLVACSGGADSLALAAAVAHWQARRGSGIAGALVVDHGWFPGSPRVAERAAQACRGLGLRPVEVLTAVGAPAVGGPEAAARDLRYAALDDAANRLAADAVLLGHTRDDQAETVLLGLARGAGARSLAGMPASRGRYRRPLLGVTRAETEMACAAEGLQPWRDPANDDPRYARARVRTAMATLEDALGPGLANALARSAEQLREDAEALDDAARDLLDRAVTRTPAPAPTEPDVRVVPEPDVRVVLELDVRVLAAAPDAVRRRALLIAARRAGSPPGRLGRSHVLAIDALIGRWRGQGEAHLPGGLRVGRRCGRLWFAPSVRSGHPGADSIQG